MVIIKIVKTIIDKSKIIIKEKIPIFFEYHFFSKKLKLMFSKIGIEDIKEFRVNLWHLGYRYYIGTYNNNKVFIKFNSNKNWIEHELEIIKYIENKSEYLSKKIPKIYAFEITSKYGFIVEEFFPWNSLKKCVINKEKIDKNKIYLQFIEIIKEMQKIKIVHLDINIDNIYISESNEIFLIDFGFSFIYEMIDYGFIGNKHRQDLILLNLNTDTRLEPGFIDDAISFLEVSKKIDPEFMSNNYNEWIIMNKLSNILVFNYMEKKNR